MALTREEVRHVAQLASRIGLLEIPADDSQDDPVPSTLPDRLFRWLDRVLTA